MTDSQRIIVVGAGHNGLVCAAYLARAGREVLVLEAAEQVGAALSPGSFLRGLGFQPVRISCISSTKKSVET